MTEIILPETDRGEKIAARVVPFLESCLPGKKLRVTVEQYRPERSDAQNNSLWGVAYKSLSDETGHSKDELHEHFCGEHFGWTEREVMGRVKQVPRRTTTKNEVGQRDVIPTVEMMAFYETVQRKASEMGFYVPSPNEV